MSSKDFTTCNNCNAEVISDTITIVNRFPMCKKCVNQVLKKEIPENDEENRVNFIKSEENAAPNVDTPNQILINNFYSLSDKVSTMAKSVEQNNSADSVSTITADNSDNSTGRDQPDVMTSTNGINNLQKRLSGRVKAEPEVDNDVMTPAQFGRKRKRASSSASGNDVIKPELTNRKRRSKREVAKADVKKTDGRNSARKNVTRQSPASPIKISLNPGRKSRKEVSEKSPSVSTRNTSLTPVNNDVKKRARKRQLTSGSSNDDDVTPPVRARKMSRGGKKSLTPDDAVQASSNSEGEFQFSDTDEENSDLTSNDGFEQEEEEDPHHDVSAMKDTENDVTIDRLAEFCRGNECVFCSFVAGNAGNLRRHVADEHFLLRAATFDNTCVLCLRCLVGYQLTAFWKHVDECNAKFSAKCVPPSGKAVAKKK